MNFEISFETVHQPVIAALLENRRLFHNFLREQTEIIQIIPLCFREKLIAEFPEFKIFQSRKIFIFTELFTEKYFPGQKSDFILDETEVERQIKFQILFLGWT